MAGGVPDYDHIVVVFEENHNVSSITASSAPYMTNTLKAGGAYLSDYHAMGHPSLRNYIAIYSGDQWGITDDSDSYDLSSHSCIPTVLGTSNVINYSESMPADGSEVAIADPYEKHHNASAFFYPEVPATSNLVFEDHWPTDFTQLPKVAFVAPNFDNDMHDGTVAAGDTWLQDKIDAYAQWALTHNSLLIVTFDENDMNNDTDQNTVWCVLYGEHVVPGTYSGHYDHYDMHATVLGAFGQDPINSASDRTPITEPFDTSTGSTSLSAVGTLATADDSGASTVTHTNTAAGNVLLLASVISGTDNHITAVTGSGSGSWTNVLAATSPDGSHTLDLWMGIVTTADSDAIHATYASAIGTTHVVLNVMEFASSNGADADWASDDYGATGTANLYPSLTASDSGELYFGIAGGDVLADGDSAGFTYTLDSNYDLLCWATDVGPGTVQPNCTGGSDRAVGVLVRDSYQPTTETHTGSGTALTAAATFATGTGANTTPETHTGTGAALTATASLAVGEGAAPAVEQRDITVTLGAPTLGYGVKPPVISPDSVTAPAASADTAAPPSLGAWSVSAPSL